MDGAHQGDRVQGGDNDMVFCVETELPQGFREYGQQVDEMEDGQDGDEFVKRVSKRFTEEQEDSYRVASNSKRADN